jgi:hypothetical protein
MHHSEEPSRRNDFHQHFMDAGDAGLPVDWGLTKRNISQFHNFT